ncbi:hypothetical protein WG31_14120 (plasmid) [Acetobacter oryzifermentans]|uniref:Uncharacterized protein n=1 Tax=Acetobacter oryzifermentans TaxID=1633874 RepID=A0ABN4NX38_9PROT|nr:hypothetical protein WG31_14120 [Acetobacter oryzifermentans]
MLNASSTKIMSQTQIKITTTIAGLRNNKVRFSIITKVTAQRFKIKMNNGHAGVKQRNFGQHIHPCPTTSHIQIRLRMM